MFFSNFFKSKQREYPITKEKRTINGYPINMVDFEKRLPWSYDRIVNSELSICHVIMLWWFDEVYKIGKTIPNYFEKNYVKSFKRERSQLISKGYLTEQNTLTENGKHILSCNYKYINLHRNSWFTKQEKEQNRIIYSEIMKKHAEWLGTVGLNEQKDRVLDQVNSDKIDHKYRIQFLEGQKLSKENKTEESNVILESLLSTAYSGKVDLYLRLAINYRKQKRYKDEIDICMQFLKTEQPKYGGDMWIDIFEKRINFSKNKLTKLH